MNKLNVFMYILIFVVAILVAIAESRDWKCTQTYAVFSKCIPTDAMPYRNSEPEDNDSTTELLEKIDNAAGYERKTIQWRMQFFTSVIIALAVFALVITPASLPVWTTFYIVTAIIMLILYFRANYITYHRYQKPELNILAATKLIRSRTNK